MSVGQREEPFKKDGLSIIKRSLKYSICSFSLPNIFIGFFILSNFFVFAAVLSLYFASYIYKYLSLIMNQGLPKRYFDQVGLISMLQTLQRFGPVLT